MKGMIGWIGLMKRKKILFKFKYRVSYGRVFKRIL